MPVRAVNSTTCKESAQAILQTDGYENKWNRRSYLLKAPAILQTDGYENSSVGIVHPQAPAILRNDGYENYQN